MAIEADGEDCVVIEELALSARIGVPAVERAQAQRLTVSISLWPRACAGEMRDQLERTVDYAAVCDEVKRVVAGRADQLIETLAEALAAHLLSQFAIARVRIELRKFILPDVKHVAVILTREQAASV